MGGLSVLVSSLRPGGVLITSVWLGARDLLGVRSVHPSVLVGAFPVFLIDDDPCDDSGKSANKNAHIPWGTEGEPGVMPNF